MKTTTKDTVEIKVAINGTDTNPFHVFGLTQSPFPQIGRMELAAAMHQLNSLCGDPIPQEIHAVEIRRRLSGWSDEFVDLCVKNYQPGYIVTFQVVLLKAWVEP